MSGDTGLPQTDLSKGGHGTLLPGDILLVTSPRLLTPRVTRLAQAIVRAKTSSRFSHAALSLGAGLIADSIPRGGVRITRISHFLENAKIESGIVVRPKNRDRLRKLATVFNRANRYYGASYNRRFLLRKSEERDATYLFCSEFVARVFQELGYPDFHKRPEKTLPIDLADLIGKSGWLTFQLAQLLKPWVHDSAKALGELPNLACDPKTRVLVERARRHDEAISRFPSEMEEPQEALLATNHAVHEFEKVLKETARLQHLRDSALVQRFRQCRDVNELKDLLAQMGLWPCWADLPRMAASLERSLQPPGPHTDAVEGRSAIAAAPGQPLVLDIVRASLAVAELAALATFMDEYLVLPGDVHCSETRLKDAIDFANRAYQEYAAVLGQIDAIRDELGESLSRSSELLRERPDTEEWQLWTTLDQTFEWLSYLVLLRFFRPDADIKAQADAVRVIGEIVEQFRSAAAGLRAKASLLAARAREKRRAT